MNSPYHAPNPPYMILNDKTLVGRNTHKLFLDLTDLLNKDKKKYE